MRSVILLDSDGVMSDFVSAVLKLVNQELETSHTYEELTDWHLYKALGVEHVGPKIDNIIRSTPGFCYSLKPLTGAVAGVAKLRDRYQVYCVTAPFPGSRYWIQERIEWLVSVMGFEEKEILPIHAKELVHGAVLVDDKLSNLTTWQAARGGAAIMFDQPWNRKQYSSERAYGWTDLVPMINRITEERAWGK